LVGATSHANSGVIDFYRKRVYHIEPHVRNKWDEVVTQSLKRAMIDIRDGFKDFEYKSLRTESCPIALQGSDNLCNTWSMLIVYLYLKHEGKYNISYLLDQIGTKMLKKRLIEFLYFVDYTMKGTQEYDNHMNNSVSKKYDLTDDRYTLTKEELPIFVDKVYERIK